MIRTLILAAALALATEGFSAEPRATRFRDFSALDPHQQVLLGGSPLALADNTGWQSWAAANDGKAAAFLAITSALALTELELAGGRRVRALDLIEAITEFRGDRILVKTDHELFKLWVSSGGRFRFLGGEVESGAVVFNRGDIGGSLHAGYDRQGYTSHWRVPRLQWNYRASDGAADIDLDGYAPLKDGWIPNPQHLTWENSDPRYWLPSFRRKFGDAGFDVNSPTVTAAPRGPYTLR